MCPTCPAHLILIDLIILVGKEYKLWRSLLCNFLQLPIISSLFHPNILLSTLFSDTHPLMCGQSFTPIHLNNIIFFIFFYYWWGGTKSLGTAQVPRYCGHFWPIVQTPDDRWGWFLEQLVEWRLAGETEVLGENLSQRHFVHHKIPHDQTRGSNPGPPRWEASD
jgi:hypothetical protein